MVVGERAMPTRRSVGGGQANQGLALQGELGGRLGCLIGDKFHDSYSRMGLQADLMVRPPT